MNDAVMTTLATSQCNSLIDLIAVPRNLGARETLPLPTRMILSQPPYTNMFNTFHRKKIHVRLQFLNLIITNRGMQLLQIVAAFCCYKSWQGLLQIVATDLLQIVASVITYRGSYYKSWQVYYKSWQVLQIVAIITKRGRTAGQQLA